MLLRFVGLDISDDVPAFLEQILLDENGNIRPRYDHEDSGQDGGASSHEDTNSHKDAKLQSDENNGYNFANSNTRPRNGSEMEIPYGQGLQSCASNPLKRRLELPAAESWPWAMDDIDIAQHLPSQPLLENVVDFFCVSFHHWVPYLHKQRLKARVREGPRSPGLHLVFHALVAVSLRHMDPSMLFLDEDQVYQQAKLSRIIVETCAIRNVSVENLQALILLVFDHVRQFEIYTNID